MSSARTGAWTASAVALGVIGLAAALWLDPAPALVGGAAGVLAAGLAHLALARRSPPPLEPREEPLPKPVPTASPTPGAARVGVREPTHDEVLRAGQLESLGMLAGGIAHDFNNLLMGIMGNAALALGELQEGPARDAIRDMEVAARRGRELVAQILAYTGRGRLEARPLDAGEVVRETVLVLGRVITPVARVDVHVDHGLVVEADPAQLRQIVMNLVTNASDSLGGAPGTITVTVAADPLDRGRLDRTDYGHELPPGRYARIEVSDTGCGMDDETRRRMFEPFFTTKFTGRGLGLAALIGILRNHRGTVDVESVLGRGTTVRVWLPLLEDAVADRSETSTDAPSVTRTGTILLAEDEDIVRRVTTRMLSKLGFDVIAVRDGHEALSALDTEDLTLALVDVQMPTLDGREVLKAVRRRRPELRVVLMTGYAGADAEANDPGPDAWLRKPFSMRDLVAAVEVARAKPPPRPLTRSGP